MNSIYYRSTFSRADRTRASGEENVYVRSSEDVTGAYETEACDRKQQETFHQSIPVGLLKRRELSGGKIAQSIRLGVFRSLGGVMLRVPLSHVCSPVCLLVQTFLPLECYRNRTVMRDECSTLSHTP